MNTRTLTPQPSTSIPLTWAAGGVILSLLVTLSGSVAAFARVNERVDHLQETTKPLRDGDLVAIQRDVAWIRAQLEREEAR